MHFYVNSVLMRIIVGSLLQHPNMWSIISVKFNALTLIANLLHFLKLIIHSSHPIMYSTLSVFT